MKKFEIAALFILAVLKAAAQPAIDSGGILNAANLLPAGLPNSAIAQGSLFIVLGKNLGPAAPQFAPSIPLGATLGGVSLSVTVGGKTLSPFLLLVSATRLMAVMPSTTPVGTGSLKVTYNGSTSSSASVQVARNAPGIFTLNGAGYGPATMQNYNSASDQPLNATIEAAHPGQIGILWGTGLGPITGDDSGPPPVGSLPFNFQVLVGGKTSKILYAGRSPEFPGIDQVNFEIPAGVSGCQVPIVLKAESAVGNYATISVAASGRVCSDWQGFSADDVTTLAGSGAMSIGALVLGQTRMTITSPSGSASSLAEDLTAAFFRRSAYEALDGPRTSSVMPGACIVHGMKTQDAIQWFPGADAGVTHRLDGGAALYVTGPNGQAQVPGDASRLYSGAVSAAGGAEYVTPGQYSVNNRFGGSDVGAFSANLALPAGLTWTNAGSIRDVTRNQPLTITWSGGDSNKEYVVVAGSAMDVANQVVGSFICAERVDAGAFTVPADALGGLPAASYWTSGGYPAGTLSVGTMPILSAVRFNGPNLDLGYFSYSRQQLINVTYK